MASHRLTFATLVAAVGAAGCGHPPAGSMPKVEPIFRSDTNAAAYFRPTPIDSFHAEWFGGSLRAMREPPLAGALVPDGATVLRFLWLRAFDPPIAVRVVAAPLHCTVTTTVISMSAAAWSHPDSKGVQRELSTRPGKILRRDSVEVPVRSCLELCAQAAAAKLWSGPVIDTAAGLDGSDWVFEVVDANGYHLAERWSPDSNRALEFRLAGIAFLRLGNALPTDGGLY